MSLSKKKLLLVGGNGMLAKKIRSNAPDDYTIRSADLPEFDMNSLMTILMGMLGLGGLRTFEKSKGVSK